VRPAPSPALPAPRAGVILAAGRSERLRGFTGGGSKALVRLGGLALLERAIRTLLRAGLDRVCVVVGYHAGPVAAVARRASPLVHVVVAEDWEEGNAASLAAVEPLLDGEPSFLLMTADHVFSPGALDGLVLAGQPAVLVDRDVDPATWEEATRVEVDAGGGVIRLGKDVSSPVVDCGAFLLEGGVFDAVRRARAGGDATLSAALTAWGRLRARPIPTGAWWQDVDTEEDLRAARRTVRRSLRRPSDGPVARFLNRTVSVPVSWALAPLRPSPTLLSWIAWATVVAGAALLATGRGLAGGLLVQAGSILDGVDGEVARLTVRDRPGGALLDGFLDRISDVAVAGGLGVWALAQGAEPRIALALALAATAGSLLSMAIKDRIVALGMLGPSEDALGWLLGGRDGRLLVVAVLAATGLPAVALGAIAATSLVATTLRVLLARPR